MIDAGFLETLYQRRNLSHWVEPMKSAMQLAEIDSTDRMVCWFAQIGHESGHLVYTKEIWGPTKSQLRYELGTTLAKTLGNTQPGDGIRYMGRGLIQTTGRANYRMTSKRLSEFLGQQVPDFEACPELLQQPYWAAMSAGVFWRVKGLNNFTNDFAEQTRRINGGYNGLAHRQALKTRAQIILAHHAT